MIIWGGGDPGFCGGKGWLCRDWNVVVTVQIALHIVLFPEKEQNFHQLRVMPQEIMVRMVHYDCPPCWVQCWCAPLCSRTIHVGCHKPISGRLTRDMNLSSYQLLSDNLVLILCK